MVRSLSGAPPTPLESLLRDIMLFDAVNPIKIDDLSCWRNQKLDWVENDKMTKIPFVRVHDES